MAERESNPTAGSPASEALDAALRGWANRDDRPLSEAEVSSIVEAINLRSEASVAGRVTPTRSARYAGVLAVAASLAILAAWGLQRSDPAVVNGDFSVAGLHDEDFSRQRRLVRGVYDLFGDQLSWLSVAPEDLRMGLDDSLERIDAPVASSWNQFTSLRLVVVRRRGATSPWRTVQEIDLLAPPEQLVLVERAEWLPGDREAAASLRVWSFPLPDGGVAIDMEGDLPVFGTLTSGSRVLRPGEVLAVAEAVVDGWEYRLLHAAKVISTSTGESGV